MKQNPCPVVGEVAKPTGVCLDELDGAVEAFSAGVANFGSSVKTVGEFWLGKLAKHVIQSELCHFEGPKSVCFSVSAP